MANSKFLIFITLLLLASAVAIVIETRGAADVIALTVSDLPPGTHYVRHPSEESEAETAGKIVMRHYATPEAIKAGGPAYGLMGYRVVSIEYEIPVDKIPVKTVG